MNTMNEFDIIERFFKSKNDDHSVLVGIGDDCAVIKPSENNAILVSVDSMVLGTHFSTITPIDAIAHKLVASNISDMTASGGIARWATLSLTLPSIDTNWLETFSQTLLKRLKYYGVSLIGGDTTRGKEIHLSLTVIGECRDSQHINRNGASAGDFICLSGEIGDAGLGFLIEQKMLQDSDFLIRHQKDKSDMQKVLQRFYYPDVHNKLAQHIKNYANAMIDVSDGVLQDLKHIINSSNAVSKLKVKCGFELYSNKIPLSKYYINIFNLFLKNKYLDDKYDDKINFALTSGEAYILCFTISPINWEKLQNKLKQSSYEKEIIKIGEITSRDALTLDGIEISTIKSMQKKGFKHF